MPRKSSITATFTILIPIMHTKAANFTILAITSMLMTNAMAQDKLSVQFLALPKQAKPEPVELLVGEGKTIEVETPGNELSPTYKIPRLSSVVVGKTEQNENGEPFFEVYGKAQSITASKQIILLIRKGKLNSDGFVVLPLNGELENFSGGSYLFINASKLNVAGIIGDKRFELKSGQRKLLKPAATHVGGGCQVTLAYQKQDKWKVFKDTRWTTTKRYRSLIFFHQHPVSDHLAVSPIIDILPYKSSATN